MENQVSQQKILNSFYLVTDRLHSLKNEYDKYTSEYDEDHKFPIHFEQLTARNKKRNLSTKVNFDRYCKNVRNSIKRYTLEKKKLRKILITKYKITPFDYHKSKKIYHRSEHAKGYMNWLSSGGVPDRLYVKAKDRKFNWQIFGTLTAGFENFSAKSCIRLVEKYFEMLHDEVSNGGKHFVKFFYVVEKFKNNYNGKDRYHIHYLLDCPHLVADIDFFDYLGDVRARREVTFAPCRIWQEVLGSPPKTFGKDSWSDIENGTVPSTARFHRTNFKRIKQDTDNYEKAVSYIVKYICKDGKGIPHFGLCTSANLLRKRWRELVVDYDNKKQHLESFGCEYQFDATCEQTGDVWNIFNKSDRYTYKSKSRDKSDELGNLVRLKCPPSYEGYIEDFAPPSDTSVEVDVENKAQQTKSVQLSFDSEWNFSHTALPTEVNKIVK